MEWIKLYLLNRFADIHDKHTAIQRLYEVCRVTNYSLTIIIWFWSNRTKDNSDHLYSLYSHQYSLAYVRPVLNIIFPECMT